MQNIRIISGKCLKISANIPKIQINVMPNGIIYLKGGDLQEETKPCKRNVFIKDLSDYFKEEFFETKKVVYLPLY